MERLVEITKGFNSSQRCELIIMFMQKFKSRGKISPATAEKLIYVVNMTSDLSELCGIDAWNTILAIQDCVYRDHYENEVYFKTDRERISALHAIDLLVIHWKGIMIFSSL